MKSKLTKKFFWLCSQGGLPVQRRAAEKPIMDQSHWQEVLSSHTKLISCFWSACGSNLLWATWLTFSTQPQCLHSLHSVASPSKPLYLAPWIHKYLHFVVLSPDLTLYDALCCLYTIFFRFRKKKKPGGLVIFQVTFRTRNRKTTLRGLST